VIALLTQLHEVTGNSEYLASATAAVRAFDVPMRDGGVRYVDDGSVWFEEYAHPEAIPSHILNGHIFALFGLDYFADHTGDQLAARLRDEGIAAVRANIHKFDGGNGMLYDLLLRHVRDVHHYHHGINVRGLYWMASHTGDDYFRYWADRFSRMVTAFG
jgi:heparosan-N-sulfate-glucuronate 5-epimerase